MIVNKRQLAEIFGKSERTFTEYQEDDMPIESIGGRGMDNQYDTVKVHEWLVQRAVAGKSKMTPLDRLNSAKAEEQEDKNLVRARVLVPADEIEPVWAAGALAMRSDLLGLGARLKALLDSRYSVDIDQEMIDSMVFGALQKLSERPLPDEEDGEIEEAMEDPE